MVEQPALPAAPAGRPSLLTLAKTWAAIGSQSLGGGPSMIYMMRLLLVERYKWLTASVFQECWAIGQAAPGMRNIALTGLLSERIAGFPGMVVSVVAMVLPSALITVLLTAGLVEIERVPAVQSAMRGIVPVTAGMTLALAVFFGRTAVRKGRVGIIDWAVFLGAALLAGLLRVPVLLILAGCALFGALVLHPTPSTAERQGRG